MCNSRGFIPRFSARRAAPPVAVNVRRASRAACAANANAETTANPISPAASYVGHGPGATVAVPSFPAQVVGVDVAVPSTFAGSVSVTDTVP